MSEIPKAVIDHYDELLATKTEMVECIGDPGYTYPHLRWMLSQIRDGVVQGDKSHRWLGFIQGNLIRDGHFTVTGERDFTRPFFRDKDVNDG